MRTATTHASNDHAKTPHSACTQLQMPGLTKKWIRTAMVNFIDAPKTSKIACTRLHEALQQRAAALQETASMSCTSLHKIAAGTSHQDYAHETSHGKHAKNCSNIRKTAHEASHMMLQSAAVTASNANFTHFTA